MEDKTVNPSKNRENKVKKIIGLDVGEKTIGCALAGENGIAVEPLPVIPRQNGALSLGPLKRLLSAYSIHMIVVGLPLRQGKNTPQSRKIKGFISKLKKHFPQITIVSQDETLSTWSAQRKFSRLKLTKNPSSKSAINIDSFAAREILEDYFQSSNYKKNK